MGGGAASTRLRTAMTSASFYPMMMGVKTRLAMLLVAAGTLPCAAGGESQPLAGAVGVRTSGPIAISLQNEVNAAMDRGRQWLMASQKPDGSWSGTNQIAVAAVAVLALWNRATPEARRAASNAVTWLHADEGPDAPLRPGWRRQEPLAWREMALSVAGGHPETARRSEIRVLRPIRPGGGALPLPRLLEECIRAMPPTGDTASPDVTNALARLAAAWTAEGPALTANLSAARQIWLYARFINRAGGGSLAAADGRVLDWRNDLARRLVATQRIDAGRGGGYWQSDAVADWASRPVAETAFALLALDEL